LAHAVVVKLSVFHGDEDDALELFGRAIVCGADGQRGLAHAARPVNERAPSAVVRVEGFADLREFRLATEDGLEAWEVGGDGGVRGSGVGRGVNRALLPVLELIQRLEDEAVK